MWEKRQIFCAEELQFMHSAYEEMHHSSLLLECRLRTVASFQNAQYGTDLTNTTSASNQRQHPVISHADSIHRDENANLLLQSSSPKHISQYNHKKNNRQILIAGHSTKYLTRAPQNLLSKNK